MYVQRWKGAAHLFGLTWPRRRDMLARLLLLLILALTVAGCGKTAPSGSVGSGPAASGPAAGDGAPAGQNASQSVKAGELIVYSGRTEYLIQPVLDRFSQETGIQVRVRYGSSPELANLVGEERTRPRADIYVGNDAGSLEVLRMNGLLAPYESDGIRHIPADLKAEDGSWAGVTFRVRVIIYNTDLLPDPTQLPRSLFDLADPRWQGKVAIGRGYHEYMVGNITAMRLVVGEERTEQFLRDLLRNKPVTLGSDTQIRNAVGRGEFPLGWVNHYYFYLEKAEGSPVGIIWPDQGPDQPGAAANITGVGLVQGGPNPENAQRFIDFMLRQDIQEMFAQRNFEIPTLPGARGAEGVPTLDEVKRMQVDLTTYGKEWGRTVDLIQKVGLP